MDWLRAIGDQGLLGVPAAWLPFVGFFLLLFVLAAAELAWPLHHHHRETRGRLAANFGLGLINALIVSVLPLSALLAADWARRQDIGLLHALDVAPVPAFAVTLLVWSLAVYTLHVLAHRVPLLWRVHRVHHADTAFDLSTGVRHHPIEPVYTGALLCGVAIAFGLDAAAIGAYVLVAAVFALWTHTNMRLPDRLDNGIRWLLLTPAAHHVHHSAARRETDSNYGDVLILWDRLFGTYRKMPQDELLRMRLGLGDAYDGDAGSLVRQLMLPLRPPDGTGNDAIFESR